MIQPGRVDGGSSPTDDIGNLDDFEPIVFCPPETDPPECPTNVMDAAIALTSTALLGNATGSDGYGAPKSTTIAAALNMAVKKCGRTTDCTTGTVTGINATVDVNYGDPGIARFVKQIIVTPGSFSAGGDSGSLIVTNAKGKKKTADNDKPVGLLFAGSATMTIANPIDAVLTRFGVTIDGKN